MSVFAIMLIYLHTHSGKILVDSHVLDHARQLRKKMESVVTFWRVRVMLLLWTRSKLNPSET